MKQFYPTGLRILTWAALSMAVIASSCKKDDTDNDGNNGGSEPTPPVVTLNNQIEYNGGDPIDIKSVIYEIDENNSQIYTFYLSPSEGITTVNGMKAADDYLMISGEKPHGQVNTSTENFAISYEDISVSKLTLGTDVESIQLRTDLMDGSNYFVLELDVKMKSGKTLLARYTEVATQYKLPILNNQYALNDAVKTIGSIVEWADLNDKTTTFYLYEAEKVTAPSEETPADLIIRLSSDIDPDLIPNGLLTTGTEGTTATPLEIDLSQIEASKISIQCGEFKTGEGATGTLTLKKNVSNDAQLSLELDVEQSGSRLRASSTNFTTVSGYESTNRMTVTVSDETKEDATIGGLYRYDLTYSNSYQFAFGAPDPESEETGAAALTSGKYAVQMDIPIASLDKTLDLSDLSESMENPPFRFYLYDYDNYAIYDPTTSNGAGATGTITALRVGSDAYYVKVDVQFPNGPKVQGEWYGTFTRSQSDLSELLLPEEPYTPRILIKSPEMAELLNWKIKQVMVRHDTNFPIGGGPTIKAYVFYFISEMSDLEDLDNSYAILTPYLAVCDDYLTCNVADMKAETNLQWYFKFGYNDGVTLLYKGTAEYGSPASYVYRTPDESSLLISKTQTENGPQWKITFKMKDWGGLQYGNPDPVEAGTNNTLEIDWEGALSPYTGSKNNDLDPSFFE